MNQQTESLPKGGPKLLALVLGTPPHERRDLLTQIGLPEEDIVDLLQMVGDFEEQDATGKMPNQGEYGQFFAYVLLKRKPDMKALRARLRDQGLDVMEPEGPSYDPAYKAQHNTASIRMTSDTAQASITLNARLSDKMISGLVEKSLLCDEAQALCDSHHHTLHVSLNSSDADLLPHAHTFFKMLRATIEDPFALAVGQHGTLFDKEAFGKLADESGDEETFAPTALLAVCATMLRRNKTCSLYTRGCEVFGYPELEVHDVTLDEYHSWLASLHTLASHCIAKGIRLTAGMQLGEDVGVAEPCLTQIGKDIVGSDRSAIILSPLGRAQV